MATSLDAAFEAARPSVDAESTRRKLAAAAAIYRREIAHARAAAGQPWAAGVIAAARRDGIEIETPATSGPAR